MGIINFFVMEGSMLGKNVLNKDQDIYGDYLLLYILVFILESQLIILFLYD